ncbi:hypothetical protein [Herbiconiux sp.]|uniref:hypothetical protein n=1 Tax=Herbiconiux sp. TaxID=1871186 RepID=UPI0025C1F6D5|nr:hypothetical protein [Herbiconiux sp.]
MIQHDDKNAQRCRGTGQMPVVRAPRAAATGGGSSAARPAAKKAASPATKGSLSVRRVEVDPDILRERQERAERLRQERAEAARDRNEVHVSYFDEPGR